MKDSKDYSPKITKLLRHLKRNGGTVEMPTYTDPVQAIVDAMVSEYIPLPTANRILKRMKSHFVDLNDLRVSRKEEILDVFKDTSPGVEKNAAAMTQTLNSLFEKYNKVALDFLCHEGKRQAKKDLGEIPGMTSFAASYCFLTALGGHSIPLNPAMLQYLREHELVHPEATEQEIAGFLERQIAAADAYAFYTLLRKEAEHAKPAAKNKKTAVKSPSKKPATKKKTAKKRETKKK